MGLREDSGSAHMGSLEFNSATYYRYVSLDLGQLYQTLNGQHLAGAIESFVKALYVAVPTARQTTMTGLSAWDYAKILVRKGQSLQASFDKPVKAKEGYLAPSIQALNDDLAKKEQMAGSLFGKIAEIELGNEERPKNIDDLIDLLVAQLPAITQE
jgi:CRISPR system Cascade subunit CasC